MNQFTAVLESPTINDERIGSARGHIRAALRELSSLNVTINAYASDDDFGQPNRCTAAMDALALALADLGDAS